MNSIPEPSIEQIRSFRLRSHHLDRNYDKSDVIKLTGACGMPNSPPGAWETALYNRVLSCSLSEMQHMLYEEKLLLQAWSFRGIPVVFPVSESRIFLSSLIPEKDEPWIYTRGITGALDFLHMSFEEVFELLKQVIPRLDETVLIGKTALDQTLAEWVEPLLTEEKRILWKQPSMYGSPDTQTVGGAAVSFLLRPCSFCGLVVFGKREKTAPVFTSYQNWVGNRMKTGSSSAGKQAVSELVKRYLHCYGPASADDFSAWLGCSGKQGRRMWETASVETEPVIISGRRAFILSADKEILFSSPSFQRELLLLGGHDPFLDQRDRFVLQPDKSLHKQIWKLVANPGVVVYRGEAVGIWNCVKKSKGLEFKITLWTDFPLKKNLDQLAGEYAAFRGQQVQNLIIND